MRICIYGASSSTLDKIYLSEAEALGRELAARGHSLVFGGGNDGIMGAVARGVSAVGGKIEGIVPKFFDEPGVIYEGCTEVIFTDTMRERKALMEEHSDASIVLPGGLGTFEELFEMLTLKQLGRCDRAIVFLNTNDYYASLQQLFENAVRQHFMSEGCLEIFKMAGTPKEAVDCVESYVPQKLGSLKRISDYHK